MFFSQMGHLMPITYLLPTSHLQFYNLPTYLNVLPTYQPTHLPKCDTYLLPTRPPTYLHIYYLPTYIPTTYIPTYLDVLPTYLFTHL
jgi:hypothetical protein